MKKIVSILVAIVICFGMFSNSSLVFADTNHAEEQEIAEAFREEIASDEEFEIWVDSTVEYGYELMHYDCYTPSSILYYVISDNENVGYIIVDCSQLYVVEFSVDESPYDKINVNYEEECVYVYENAIEICSVDGFLYFVESDGSLSAMEAVLYSYDPQLQGSNNCIVAAISNLFWYYGGNGYSPLTRGKTFSQLKAAVDSIMIARGGYTNNNIPGTISTYVSNNTSYTVTSTNVWNPTISQVVNEVVTRPCLLGFAAGSTYSSTAGHMTVCVGTSVQGGRYYVKVMDGHSTTVQNKLWGTYNDFICKVRIS